MSGQAVFKVSFALNETLAREDKKNQLMGGGLRTPSSPRQTKKFELLLLFLLLLLTSPNNNSRSNHNHNQLTAAVAAVGRFNACARKKYWARIVETLWRLDAPARTLPYAILHEGKLKDKRTFLKSFQNNKVSNILIASHKFSLSLNVCARVCQTK